MLHNQHATVMPAEGHGSGEGHARGRHGDTRCEPLYKGQRVRALQDAGAVYNLHNLYRCQIGSDCESQCCVSASSK